MPSPVRRRHSASPTNTNQSSKEKQQPSGENSCERTTTTTTTMTTVATTKAAMKTEMVMDGNEGELQLQQQQSSSSMSQSRQSRTSISPRTRGNSIARILASPGDLLHDNNLDKTNGSGGGGGNSATRRELPRRSIITQNKFISPNKRSTAEATLNLLARRRITRNSNSLEETENGEVVRRPKHIHAAVAAATATATDTSSLTTPGGRRRKRKAACDAQSKVRDICELEDFDQLDELLLDSSRKVPYNEPSLTMNQGRKKRTSLGRSVGVAGAGAVVSDIVVVADRKSPAASPTSLGMQNNGPSTPRIVAGTASNNTVDTKAASFIPVGKVEERWFRNFNKWRCNSSSSSTTATASPTKNASTLVTTSTMPPPTSPPPRLWIREQRVQYNLWKHHQKSQMTKERVDLLESAGFCWEMNERKKVNAAAAASSTTAKKNGTTSKMNLLDADGTGTEHVTSKDANQAAGTNLTRQSTKRKLPRESLTTQFYHNLGEGTSESIKDNQSQILLRDSSESATSTTTKTSLMKRQSVPNAHSSAVISSHPTTTTDDDNIKVDATSEPISPKIRSKNGRRGRYSMDSMASLMALDIPTESRSVPGAGKKKGGAATLRSESLSYKELEMAVSKSLQQKARKKSSATKSSSSTDSKIEKKSSDRKVDGSDKTETSEGVDVPLINCNDLSPSLESPLLVMTRLPTSTSASKDPQSHPAAVAAKSTEPVCVRKLMLSCLSDESPPAESGDNSIRSDDDEHENPSSNSTTDEKKSLATSMNSKVGSDTVSSERGEDAFVKSRSVGDTLQLNLDSSPPVARFDPTLPDNATNIDHTPGSRSAQQYNAGDSPSYTSYDAAHVNSPWEHDTDFTSTIEAKDIYILSNSPDPSNAANKPRRLFSPSSLNSPTGNASELPSRIPQANNTHMKETGTQTADPPSQTSETHDNIPFNVDSHKDAKKDESFMYTQSHTRIRPANNTSQKETGTQTADPAPQTSDTQANLLSNTDPQEGANNDESSMQLYSPLSLTEPSQTRIQHDGASKINTKESDTQTANPSSRSLVTSNVASHYNGNLGAHVPVALQAVEPTHSIVEYQNKWTNFGLIEMEMKLVAQRMRELEEKMKLVDSYPVSKNNCVDGERGESASMQAVAYRPNSRSRSTRKRHHSSSDYYESSEDECTDEYYPPSPPRRRRPSGYRGPKMVVGNPSNRRVDAHKASAQRSRSRSKHDDRRNGRSSKQRLKSDERYYSDRSDSSEDSYADDRHQTQGTTKKRSGRKKDSELNASSGSKESRTNRQPKRRHPVSVLETASPSKPAVADDHSEDEKSAHSEPYLASKTSVVKPKTSQKVDAKPSEVVQRNDSAATGDGNLPPVNNGNESNENYTSCVFGDRSRAPLFWLARGESSSDDESWDFDGPMILPPPPL